MILRNRGGRITDLYSDLEGHQLLALDMLRTSAALIKTAQRLGHLSPDLRLTSKPIKPNSLGKVVGFQSGVVSGPADILSEVNFWKGGAAARCAEVLGIGNPDPAHLLDRFRGSIERQRRNNFGDPGKGGRGGKGGKGGKSGNSGKGGNTGR